MLDGSVRGTNQVLGDGEQAGHNAAAGIAPPEIDAALQFGPPLEAHHLCRGASAKGPTVGDCLSKAALTAQHDAILIAMAANPLDDAGSKRPCAERWLTDTVSLPATDDLAADHPHRPIDVLTIWAEGHQQAVFLLDVTLFRLNCGQIFYDTTTVHFEIDMADEKEPLQGGGLFARPRRRGRSKEGSDTQPQELIAVLVTWNGIAARSRVLLDRRRRDIGAGQGSSARLETQALAVRRRYRHVFTLPGLEHAPAIHDQLRRS